MRRKIIFFVFFFLIIARSFTLHTAFADTQDDLKATEKKIDHLKQVLGELVEKRNTLKSEIQYMDSQIQLKLLEIEQTESKIKILTVQVEDLSDKIGILDDSLNDVSLLLINRVVATYKSSQFSPIDLLFSSASFSNFFRNLRYFEAVQKHDRQVLTTMEEIRLDYDNQKQIKETKQLELKNLKSSLAQQKIDLDSQKKDKEYLLSVTQNDEKKYQALLADAKAELASLKSFTSKQVGGVLPAQNSPDGWFYSQRDERWAHKLIGTSTENIYDVGCLIACVAMVHTQNGVHTTPIDIASNSSYFFPRGTAYMKSPWPSVAGKSPVALSNLNEVDVELSAGRPVIVHLSLGGDGHFVVLKEKRDGDYIMHDPWHGYDKKFSDFYSVYSIDKRVVYR